MPMYGYHRNTTPFLNSISSKSNIYLAVSTSSYTSPAVASILTGLNPHNHGCVIDNDPRYLAEKDMPYGIYDFVLTLPEVLSVFGFNTYFNSGVVFAELPSRGRFKYYSLAFEETHRQVEDFIKWIKLNSTGRTFSYIHLDTLHIPIECPTKFLNVFGEIASIPRLNLWDYREGNVDSPRFKDYRENRIKLYDSALCYVDFELRNLFEALKDLSILDNSIIIVTSDHGEEFWEHVDIERKYFYDPRGFYGVGHGHNLFREIVEVPLIIIGRSTSKNIFKERVSLIDITPTILDIVGIKHDLHLDGVSLLRYNPSQTYECLNRPLICEDIGYGYEKKAVYYNKYKLIVSKGDRVSLLYNFIEDSREESSLNDNSSLSMLQRKAPRFLSRELFSKLRSLKLKRL